MSLDLYRVFPYSLRQTRNLLCYESAPKAVLDLLGIHREGLDESCRT